MRKLKKYITAGLLSAGLLLSVYRFHEVLDNHMEAAEADYVIQRMLQAVQEKAVKGIGADYIEHIEQLEERLQNKKEPINEKEIKYPGSSSTPQEMAEYIRINMPELPEYNGMIYEVVNENEPLFIDKDASTASFEYYSDLDVIGRCQTCVANIGYDLMPVEERGAIGNIKPSGWIQNKYPGLVEGNYLYNRCHLIGYQLTGENANEKNLITGIRAVNTEGMLPFENMVADYIKETKNHVLYRVTPVFEGNNQLAAGVLMEAKSVEDKGEGITFCVFVFNVQKGIQINYADGSNQLLEE